MAGLLDRFSGKRADINLVSDAADETPLFPDIDRVDRLEQVGQHQGVLTAPGELLALGAPERERMALVSRGNFKAELYFTNRRRDLPAYEGLLHRAIKAGFEIVAMYEVERRFVGVFYGNDAAATMASYAGPSQELLDDIVRRAIRKDASDIHLVVGPEQGTVRLRIHGDMHHEMTMRASEAGALIEAAYNLAKADSKRAAPVFNRNASIDAMIERKLEVDGKPHHVNLRWASGPAYPDGTSLTLRVLHLGVKARNTNFVQLGHTEDHQDAIERALRKPHGIILLVGATGSGKSTTLATMGTKWLRMHNHTRVLRTIEDPVEYIIEGAVHRPVTRREGEADVHTSDFGDALRNAMRQDPDGILVGEIRDRITAQLTKQAIETGHKVFATLHADSCFGAVERLIELGVERSTFARKDFVNLIIYQHLIPTLCPHCKVGWEKARRNLDPAMEAGLMGYYTDDLNHLYFRGAGCDHCRHLGVAGRSAIAEMLVMDRTIQTHLVQNETYKAEMYWAGAYGQGSRVQGYTLKHHCLDKMRAGIVSPEDVEKTLGDIEPPDNSEDRAAYARATNQSMVPA
jgi:general secretion pathway protein E